MDPSAARPAQGCKFHPPLSAKATCKSCGAPLCSLCIRFVSGKVLCEGCEANAAAPRTARSGVVPSPANPPSGRSGVVAAPSQPSPAGSRSGVLPVPGAAPSARSGVLPAAASSPSGRSGVVPAAPGRTGLTPAPVAVSPGSSAVGDPVQAAFPTPGLPTASGRIATRREESAYRRAMYCKKHPGVPAEKKCELCGGNFCIDCVREVHNKMLCPDCARPGGSSVRLERKPHEKPRSFAERLPEAFLYPFKGDRIFLLLGGALALWCGFIGHWIFGVAVCLGIGLWLMKIVRLSAFEREYDSTLPGFGNAANDLIKPFGFLLFAALVSLVPAFVYTPIGNPDLIPYVYRQAAEAISGSEAAKTPPARNSASDTSDAAAKTFGYRIDHDSTLKLLLLAAALIFPLALSLVSLYGIVDVLSPPMLLNAFFKHMPLYMIMVSLLAAGIAPAWYLVTLTESFSSLSGLLATSIILYFAIVAFRVFGSAYAADKESFVWVGLPTVKP